MKETETAGCRRRITAAIALARYHMYTEASEHLLGDITEDMDERCEAQIASEVIARIAIKWLNIHHNLKAESSQ